MKLHINGETRDSAARTLTELLAEMALVDAVVATAVNGGFVPKGRRGDHQLKPGDTVEVVAPMKGG